ncbi:aspartic peptidase domain-containing protein [Mycena amicta]|nr:aspartic peptidase domain-containing protein [Mycena amicta]
MAHLRCQGHLPRLLGYSTIPIGYQDLSASATGANTANLDSAQFAFWLSRPSSSVPSNKVEPGGILTFGGANTSLYSGDIEFLDCQWIDQGSWALNGSPISINSSTNRGIFMTGWGVINGPLVEVAEIWERVPGSSEYKNGFYQFPCATAVNVTVGFGGKTWRIDPVDMSLGPVTPGSASCIGAISVLDSRLSEYWIFGQPFLFNVYSVYSEIPAAVGFASLFSANGRYSASTVRTNTFIASTVGATAFIFIFIFLPISIIASAFLSTYTKQEI